LDTCYNNGDGYTRSQYNGTHVLSTEFRSGDSQCLKPKDTSITEIGNLPVCVFEDENGASVKFEIVNKPAPLAHKTSYIGDLFDGNDCKALSYSFYYYVPSCLASDNTSIPYVAMDCDKDTGFQYVCKDDVCHNCAVTDTLDLNVCIPDGEVSERGTCQPPAMVSSTSEGPTVELKRQKSQGKLRDMPIARKLPNFSSIFKKTK